MAAFDLGASVTVGTATRVVIRDITLTLTPPGSETLTVNYQLTDAANTPLKSGSALYPAPAALVAAAQAHLATKLQALIGQTATLNPAAGV